MSITHTHMPACKPTHLVWTVKSENRNDDQQREMLSTLALELARTRAVFPSLSLSVSDSLSSSLSRPLSRRKTPLSRSRAHTQTRTRTHTHTHTPGIHWRTIPGEFTTWRERPRLIYLSSCVERGYMSYEENGIGHTHAHSYTYRSHTHTYT